MEIALILILGFIVFAPVIGIIIGIFLAIFGKDEWRQKLSSFNNTSAPKRRTRNRRRSGFFDDNSSRNKGSHSSGNPFDNHWESSFDWQDKNNDGYDDRDDGFWNEREF